jgi:hypothetical protein
MPAQPSIFSFFLPQKSFAPIPKKDKRFSKMMRAAVRKTGALASRTQLPSSSMGVTRDMSGKVIKFGVEGRAAMLKGVNTLADAVQVSRASLACMAKLMFSIGSCYALPYAYHIILLFALSVI